MIGCALLLAASLSAGNAEFDRTAAEGAARISFDRFTAACARKGLDAHFLREAMLASSADFRERSAAETRCAELYSERLERTFSAEAGALRKRLGLEEDFPLEGRPEDRVALLEAFPAVFDAERKAAVAEQAQGLVAETRPTEEELETKDDGDLRREMTERLASAQTVAVFEENLAYISEHLVAPILASGRVERVRQAEYLKRARSDAAVPSRLAAALREKLAANVAERMKGVGPTFVWGVFPSVREVELPAEVDRRLVRRFAETVERETLAVTAGEVAEIIARDAAAHAKAADSARIFEALYAGRVLTQAVARAIADLPAEDREEWRAALLPRVGSGEFASSAERAVRREVMPKWKAAREEVAKRLAAATWPTLADGMWFPDASVADEVVARSDYGEAVKGWRSLGALSALAKAEEGKAMLEESRSRADRGVGAAFDLARTAIAAQNAIVAAVAPGILDEARRQAWKLETVIGKLLEATTAQWDATRLGILWPKEEDRPANATAQHAALFPSVRARIELEARRILEQPVEKEERAKDGQPQAKETPPEEEKPPEEEPPPEETPPDNPPPEDEPPEEMLFSLSVRETGEGLEIKLLKGKKVVESSTVPAKASDFRTAMEQLTRVISSEILKLEQ